MAAVSGIDGLFGSLSRCLDTASARGVVNLQVDLPVQKRIGMLAHLANRGTLNDNERSEYEALINAADLSPSSS